VRIRGATASLDIKHASTHLSSSDGGQVSATLSSPTGGLYPIAINDIAVAGEYSGTMALNPLDPNSPALDLTVRARHHWLWPLLLVFIGAASAAGGRLLYSGYHARRKARADGKSSQRPRHSGGGLNGWWEEQEAWISQFTKDNVRWDRLPDAVVYLGALLVAAVAFVLPVYSATNFDTVEQYVGIFVAGALGKVLVDQGLALRATAADTAVDQDAPATKRPEGPTTGAA
jgi:hypothetical protein